MGFRAEAKNFGFRVWALGLGFMVLGSLSVELHLCFRDSRKGIRGFTDFGLHSTLHSAFVTCRSGRFGKLTHQLNIGILILRITTFPHCS